MLQQNVCSVVTEDVHSYIGMNLENAEHITACIEGKKISGKGNYDTMQALLP